MKPRQMEVLYALDGRYGHFETNSIQHQNGHAILDERKVAAEMDKPLNPYRQGTVIWNVMQGSLDGWPEGGWADLTAEEIAEVLETSRNTVSCAIGDIRRDTGYQVPHIDGRGRRYGYQ